MPDFYTRTSPRGQISPLMQVALKDTDANDIAICHEQDISMTEARGQVHGRSDS